MCASLSLSRSLSDVDCKEDDAGLARGVENGEERREEDCVCVSRGVCICVCVCNCVCNCACVTDCVVGCELVLANSVLCAVGGDVGRDPGAEATETDTDTDALSLSLSGSASACVCVCVCNCPFSIKLGEPRECVRECACVCVCESATETEREPDRDIE